MNAGNQAMSAEQFAEAITHFQSALVYKPEDENAAKLLAAAEKAENDRVAALRTQYNAFMRSILWIFSFSVSFVIRALRSVFSSPIYFHMILSYIIHLLFE